MFNFEINPEIMLEMKHIKRVDIWRKTFHVQLTTTYFDDYQRLLRKVASPLQLAHCFEQTTKFMTSVYKKKTKLPLADFFVRDRLSFADFSCSQISRESQKRANLLFSYFGRAFALSTETMVLKT